MRSAISVTLLALVHVVVVTATNSLSLVDKNSFGSSAVNQLCQDGDLFRIGRISSIRKLTRQFEATKNEPCSQYWLQPLRDFHVILDSSARDACSLETIELIEQFHWYYVLGTLSRTWRKAAKSPIPEPLKIFFMHFVNDLTAMCKSSMALRLKEASTRSGVVVHSLPETSKGFMLDALSVLLVPQPRVKKFSDFFLIFNSVIALEKKKGRKVPEETPDPVTGEVRYISVKVHDANKQGELQDKCRQQLRPVYSNTVLPVMKLIDLGYGSNVEDTINSDLIANWYGLTQVCQLLVPVKFYSSSALKKGQISMVSEEEARILESPEISVAPPNIRVRAVLLKGDLVSNADSDHVAESVKTNFKARGKVHRRTVKNLLVAAKSELKSKFKSVFVSRRNQNNEFVLEREDNILKEIDQTDRMLQEDELEDDERSSGLRYRYKRSFTKTLGGLIALVLIVICVLAFLSLIGFLIAMAVLGHLTG